MDAFYASVEELHDPSLANKPMAVGGMGMICTANYEVRFGLLKKCCVLGPGTHVEDYVWRPCLDLILGCVIKGSMVVHLESLKKQGLVACQGIGASFFCTLAEGHSLSNRI